MVSTWISADRTMILLVDDDPDITEALSDLLEHEGYHVHLAVNGGKALEKAKQHHYSAVILDLGLPDMDGLEGSVRVSDQAVQSRSTQSHAQPGRRCQGLGHARRKDRERSDGQ
jgi:CheY-like chemotaxis protein